MAHDPARCAVWLLWLFRRGLRRWSRGEGATCGRGHEQRKASGQPFLVPVNLLVPQVLRRSHLGHRRRHRLLEGLVHRLHRRFQDRLCRLGPVRVPRGPHSRFFRGTGTVITVRVAVVEGASKRERVGRMGAVW